MSDAALTLNAYAKVNLDLRILGLLPDGYHQVRTVLQSVRLHDTLVFTPAPGPLVITCDDPAIPTGEQNLIWRAAAVLGEVAAPPRTPSGVRVDVVKRIQAQAGLGGGSADAAATLLALTRLWGLRLDLADLARVGARLGADVPFFLSGGTALGVGRGDDVSPLTEPPPASVVLVTPPFGVATPDAYRWFDLDGPPRHPTAGTRPLPSWPAWASGLRNDLEPPVARRHPAISRIVRALRSLGADHAAMSGSGSAVFGVFLDAAAAATAHAALVSRGERALHTATLSRDDVARQRRRVLHSAAVAAG
jgi:4-diphosphocytidyl-2-C-methyl-D-erythritol kinase